MCGINFFQGVEMTRYNKESKNRPVNKVQQTPRFPSLKALWQLCADFFEPRSMGKDLQDITDNFDRNVGKLVYPKAYEKQSHNGTFRSFVGRNDEQEKDSLNL